jgi:hypothetical protein
MAANVEQVGRQDFVRQDPQYQVDRGPGNGDGGAGFQNVMAGLGIAAGVAAKTAVPALGLGGLPGLGGGGGAGIGGFGDIAGDLTGDPAQDLQKLLQVQIEVQQQTLAFTTQTNILKAQHDANMSAARNVKS